MSATPKAPPLTPLGQLILDVSAEKGWSIRRVARQGGIPEGTLRRYTTQEGWNGKSAVKPELLQQIADGLGEPLQRVIAAYLETAEVPRQTTAVSTEQWVVVEAMAELEPHFQVMVADVVMRISRELRPVG